jgi:hypothetical protein
MAKLTRSNSVAALVDSIPTFGAHGPAPGFSIGLASRDSGITYHLHLSDDEARRFAAFVNDFVELEPPFPTR